LEALLLFHLLLFQFNINWETL